MWFQEHSYLDVLYVSASKITRNNGFKIRRGKETHIKKLTTLGANIDNHTETVEVIFSFSDRLQTNEEKDI